MMPEIVQALANIRLVMLTSYRNMTNVLDNASEDWSLDQKMVLDNFETRMNKILTNGLSNIQLTTKNLEEIQTNTGVNSINVLNDIFKQVHEIKNLTLPKFQAEDKFDKISGEVTSLGVKFSKSMNKEIKSLSTIIDSSKRTHSMDIGLLSSHVETVSQKTLMQTRTMMQEMLKDGVAGPVNASYHQVLSEMAKLERETIQRKLQINEILRIVEVVSREQQRYQGRIDNRMSSLHNAIGMLDGPGSNITSHLLPIIKGTLKLNHETALSRFTEHSSELDGIQRKLARIDHLVQEKLKDLDFALSTLTREDNCMKRSLFLVDDFKSFKEKVSRTSICFQHFYWSLKSFQFWYYFLIIGTNFVQQNLWNAHSTC